MVTPSRSRTALRAAAAALAALAALAGAPTAARASGDEFSQTLWGLKKVRAEAAWAKGAAGQGAVVAVVDSGVDPRHEDLRGNVVAGRDFVDGDDDAMDESGHGTHVAGIVAATANNGVGVAGVAPKAKIMPVRVLNADGAGSQSDIEAGVRWAVQRGADVVNLSLSADVLVEFVSGGTLTDAVNYAWANGVVPVISAGNEQFFRSELRGARAIVVTATTPSDTRAPYATSVGFAEWGMAAPGGTSQGGEKNMILSTWWDADGRTYAYQQGTSMAAPHVAGAAAVLRGMGLSAQQTVDRLLSTAVDIGARGRDSVFGHGRLDVAAAVQGPGGSEGEAGEPGSSAEGSSATGRPGQDASGTRGSPGEVPVRPRRAADTPSPTPSPTPTRRPTPAATAAPEEEEDSGAGLVIAVALGATAVAVLVGVAAWRRRSARAG